MIEKLENLIVEAEDISFKLQYIRRYLVDGSIPPEQQEAWKLKITLLESELAQLHRQIHDFWKFNNPAE